MSDVLAPPDVLTPAAAERWRSVVGGLAAAGPVDVDVLTTYCQVWARWREAEDGIQKSGQLIKRGNRITKNPLAALSKDAFTQVKALEKKLGLGQEPPTEESSAPPAVPGDASGPLVQWPYVDRDQLAAVLGKHPDTITEYTRLGMPVVQKGGRGARSVYHVIECAAWWRNQQGLDPKEAAQARAYASTAALNEMRLQRERGQLLNREDVIRDGQTYTKAWAAKVAAIPRQLVLAGVIERGDEAAVAAVCRQILTEISNWRTVADVETAATGTFG